MQNIKDISLEIIYAVLPITVVVIILQFTLIWLSFEVFLQFLVGVVLVSIGLIFFLTGVHLGLLPIGEMIGSTLPKTGKITLVVLFAFLMGLVVTVAEPDVRVLATQIDIVSQGEALPKSSIFRL